MHVKRIYEGDSQNGNLQEALEKAIENLNADLSEDGTRDASASWFITGISGTHGGIAGLKIIKVTITAKRSPDWQSG